VEEGPHAVRRRLGTRPLRQAGTVSGILKAVPGKRTNF
jgi:hypothetical protein